MYKNKKREKVSVFFKNSFTVFFGKKPFLIYTQKQKKKKRFLSAFNEFFSGSLFSFLIFFSNLPIWYKNLSRSFFSQKLPFL